MFSILCFTEQGAALTQKLCTQLTQKKIAAEGHSIKPGFGLPAASDLYEWTKERFSSSQVILFIGAAGIAVRAIAPFLQHKTVDPAVLVADDTGKFVISLLSGHMGGANQWANQLAEMMGAIPVITTATDRNGVFAVDQFAKENGFFLSSMELAKKVSAQILGKEPVGFYSQFPFNPPRPKGFVEKAALGISFSIYKRKRFDKTLFLVPPVLVLGIGCRKGVKKEAIEQLVMEVLEKEEIWLAAVSAVASIDNKKNEEGLQAFCNAHRLPFFTYPGDVLEEMEGEFTASQFVKQTVGCSCVCERAAVYHAKGLLLKKKVANDGVTVAVAQKKERMLFGW